MIRGTAAWCRLLFSSDPLDFALGSLEVEPGSGREGEQHRCRVRVANASSRLRAVSLVLEIAPAGDEEAERPPLSRWVKRLHVAPLGLMLVELEHDFRGIPRFRVDGRDVSPDELSASPSTPAGLLAVRARLFEGDRELHRPLTAYLEHAG